MSATNVASRDASEFVEFNKMVLSFWGMWPGKEDSGQKWGLPIFHWCHRWVVFAGMSAFFFGQLYDIYSNIDDVVAVSENSTLMFTTGSLMVKLMSMILQKAKFHRLMDFLRCDEFKASTKAHSEIINKRIENCSRTSKSFCSISVFTLISYLLFPLFEMSRRMPSPIKIPLINLKSSPMFEIGYAFEVWSLSGLALMNSSMDTLIAAFMSQAIAQLDCLIDSLKYVIEIDPEEIGKVTYGSNEVVRNDIHFVKRSAKATENIKKAIAYHRIILRYVNEVQDYFNISICVQYFVSGVVICCSGVIVVVTPGNQPFKLIATASYLITMMSEIFMLCWFGNEIMAKSEYLIQAIYNTPWMDCSESYKKNMRIFMIRTQVPLIVTAGKMFKLNLNSFASILNTSYSYFALLRHMYTDDGENKTVDIVD